MSKEVHYLPGVEAIIKDHTSPLYTVFSLPYRYRGHEGRVLFGLVEFPSLLLTTLEKSMGTHSFPVTVWIRVGLDGLIFHKQQLPLLSQQRAYESPKGLMQQLDIIRIAAEEAKGLNPERWSVVTAHDISFWYEKSSHTIRMTIGKEPISQIIYSFSAVRR